MAHSFIQPALDACHSIWFTAKCRDEQTFSTASLGLSMPLSDFESEDIALLGSVAVAAAAALIDTFYDSEIFKALKILALFLSLWLAYHRIKTSKPYFKDMPASAWKPVGQQYEVRIPKSEHNRGKSPHARCLVPGQSGGYAECFTDAEVAGDGEVVVQINTPENLRIEIRK